MNVYLLERWPKGSARTGEVDAMVVTAGRANTARQLAKQSAGPEGARVWVDAERSTCKLVAPSQSVVIARSVQP